MTRGTRKHRNFGKKTVVFLEQRQLPTVEEHLYKKQTIQKNFPQLDVIAIGFFAIWRIDLAYRDKDEKYNNMFKYLSVTVDRVSR